ncbi:YegS/Rv2252/BmrU family lipid kinase [Alkaliphilus pronyensis]|uniref:YegS/Rv2252/BmrU family lipid kinase n=1 Tax=Alkaliphilus pronyensis TaxID=1482732 RepID=A0A6I0F7L1_9FIRM|nr:YegS/Rv2252/BmrU family lipid kinase [Alkaliphilus pronyensis]KAB3530351.1 YegS/Rv2252/BmrU family lipid kinase [Alkaliphilus pronyensis]
MKKSKIKIIYNPNSGRKLLLKTVPKLLDILVNEYNMDVDMEGTKGKHHATEIAIKSGQQGYHVIIAAGGDGTINEVINGMVNNSDSKLAIYPAGTVNDFATHLNVPRQLMRFAEMIHLNHTVYTDVGKAGDRYFLNVAAGGLLTDVAYRVSSDAKTVLGKFAYYLEGIREFPKQIFKPIRVKLQIGNVIEEKEILFYIIANSKQVGGFKNIASEAKIDDGLLDLIVIENTNLIDVASLFFLIIKGNHINHPSIKYMQVKEFTIESDSEVAVDIDGEMGGRLPMTFKVIKSAIPIIIPPKETIESYIDKNQHHLLFTKSDI